ncbi:SpoIIE family protein phosphatase [Actinoplanes rectilineatus]|uniref:SpoIIE family protein phosphatase n=1 Tax=Actinoplanes rectilineatus TaxID=113571 RepID=UPI0005F2E5A5|nr:SpoIIE family protein phosphatase [Actinoplanes rectilineatus]
MSDGQFEVFAVGGDVGRDLAAVPWGTTPLGPPQDWPQSLRTAVSIMLSSRFAMWIAYGPDLTFFCNDAYRRDTLGSKYPWALGRPAHEVWAEIWHDIGPRIRTVLSTGEATWDEGLLLFLERSGYREESYHTFSYSPLHDDAGTVTGMLCVVSEDTERVIGGRRMATLRDLGSDPSVVRTEQQMLTFSAEQLGRNLKDLPFTLTYLFDGDDARLAASTGIPAGHALAPAVLTAGAKGTWPADALARQESVLVTLDDADGPPTGDWDEPPTQALVTPLLQQGGTPYGFMVAALNRFRALDDAYRGFVELAAGHVAAGIAGARSYAAQQRRAEDLAELDRAKTTFFSNISHEFRTPLTLIMGPVQDLLDRPDTSPELREELDVVHRNGLRMGRLVTTLLDFSRIEAGRMQAHYEPVDLAAATAELASVFRGAVERAGLHLTVDCPPMDRPVDIDRGMWEKVILNLLSNALKFTFTGGLTVTVRPGPDAAVVTVADTGIGIAAAEMPRLFERFHRIESARSRSNEGSGIGLALVKELVELHDGVITASSTEGVGTVFTIRMPFSSGTSSTDTSVISNAAQPFVQEALRWLPGDVVDETPLVDGVVARVLIADDNADMRDYLVRLLRSEGHRVEAVVDGQAALDAARADVPDLIISDVMMPRLDGLRLAAALRADPRTASVPVLLLSARAGQEASIEGLQAGADDYLVKPFSSAELLARVQTNVALSRLRTHHARWRTALIDSLQEAFFVCAEDGTVIEINSTFTDILGYGPEGLPYPPVHPWWPDPDTDPAGYQKVADALALLVDQPRGDYTIPVTHRDGHTLWVAATFSQVTDPGTGTKAIVGTFRDVTAEHYAVQRESALAAVAVRLSQAESTTGALHTVLPVLQELWQATHVYAAVFDGSPTPVLSTTDTLQRWDTLPAARRQALSTARDQPVLTPIADQPGGAGITLEHPDGAMVLWIELAENRPFTEHDQTLLALLAGHLNQSLHRLRQIDQQRETALALQRAILGPAQLPDGFAVRYAPATQPLKVGGDWYDTVALPDERIGLVVGDCVGHGLQAATVMGQLRSACRALLLQNTDPAQTLTALDSFAAQIPGAMCATVFCGVLDPVTGELAYSTAGHPPAVVALVDGTTDLLDEGRGRPLGVRGDVSRPEARYTMPPRATLLLYTDGLVERRRQSLNAGIDRVAATIQRGRATALEELASDVMDRMAPTAGYEDDVALLLYRQPGPLALEFTADADRLAPVRSALRGWLKQAGVDRHTAQNVLVAAGEACANAIEHGHRHGAAGLIRLHAFATGDDLRLTVIDSGSWKTPQPEINAHRGRGLQLMRALMHEVTVTTSTAGTVVGLQARILP